MTVKLGHFEIIENKDKPVFSHAKDTYIAGYVCGPKGENPQYIMFADTELADSCKVDADLPLDLGHMYRICQSGKNSYLFSCHINGEPVVFKISESRVKRALHRTAQNPEDIKELSFWSRLFR